MRIDHGELVVSPTDITKFLACRHLTALDLEVAHRTRRAPGQQPDELLELLFRKGDEHERMFLAELEAAEAVVRIDNAFADVADAALRTERAMSEGAAVIYQATFLHAGRRGHADFLFRAERPSDLGGWSYDVADTKLARRLKVPALLQMASYGEHLRRLQGSPPVTLTVIAGDHERQCYAFSDVESYARRVSGLFDDFVAHPPTTVADPVQHCAQCRWIAHCYGGWRAADHLTFVAFLSGTHRHALEEAGITTLTELAHASPDALPRAIGRAARTRIVRQAALQLEERDTRSPVYELLEPRPGVGLLSLPEPDPADLYLDFEADRYAEPDGREFLAGVGDRDDVFSPIWAHSFDEERALTERLIDAIVDRWRANPGMHVYHYAPYEKSALLRLTARHGVREAELDVLLRAEVLVDLYAVVRQGLRISKESYSIKKMEAFYWGHIRSDGADDVADAISSVLEYESWLLDHDPVHLDAIAAYNVDDVRSTHDLHDWLEERRTELEGIHGETYPRRSDEDPAGFEPGDAERAEIALAERCTAEGQPLLGALVGWHRREERPAWRDVFRLRDLDDSELVDDGTPLGGLSGPDEVGQVAQSRIYRYTFPPQDTKLARGSTVRDVDEHNTVGTIESIDPAEGWLQVRRARRFDAPTSRGFGPDGPMNTAVLKGSIARIAESIVGGGDNLGRRLLERRVPAGLPVRERETAGDAVTRIGLALDGAVLAVQGPPGTGKSYSGAELIRRLLDQGFSVGVTALSHSVIGNLLTTVARPALQKATEQQWCADPQVERADSNQEVVDALADGSHRLVGGTAWLWAREDMAESVDVLVIDEAGQFSLANALAVTQAARSLVLLGDPQQLTQPSQAVHPDGAGTSVLEHLLGEHDTIPDDRGVFLDRTWRMHPSITEFVSITSYEGRLESVPGTRHQSVVGADRWAGSGLRHVPVEHDENASASTEEAVEVAAIVSELLQCEWIDADRRRRPITARDVLIVAPYNAHVARLREHIPDPAVAIGTVDKFQGREAAVVIYSLASSSAAAAPHGVDFLYDIHRLNVAVSRARAMTIVVCSPDLLDAEVSTPHQLRLVNALCRYVETSA